MRTLGFRALFTAAILAPFPALGQDADMDGAPDSADARPCDPAVAGLAYAPAEGQSGLILFEDHWPSRESDEDFNDVAVAYNYIYTMNAAGRVTRVQVTLTPLAAGGGFPMGLGLHLPIPRGDVASVTLSTGGGAATALTPSGADAELTVTLVSDLASVFGNPERPINSVSGSARAAGQVLAVDVRLSNPAALFAASAPHDLYIFHTETPSHEIHLSRYSGTTAMDRAMFGRWGDGSYEGRWFIDEDKIPMALLLPLGTVYPREETSISALFPRIGSWAESNGTLDADFYLNDTVTAQAWRDSAGQGAAPAATPPSTVRDVSCVAVDRPINSSVTLTDANIASYRGTRWIVSAGVTVTLNTTQPVEIDSLDLAGTLQPAACTLSTCAAVDLRVANTVTIRSSGLIQADGRGYLGSLMSGNGMQGRTYGNAASTANALSGGSHGGYGGIQAGAAAAVYGDFLHPVLPGGGATSNNTTNADYAGGNGGGVIRVTAAGVLTIDGRVRANGGRGPNYDAGGAGGSVWLAGSQVRSTVATGTVLVQANGSYGYYSGGGGGRVAVYGTPAGTFDPTTMVQAIGGPGGIYGVGGAGTVAYGTDQPGQQSVIISSANYNSAFANTRLGAYGAVSSVTATTLTTNTWLQPGLLAGRTLIADAEGAQAFTIASNTANTITISGTGLNNATAVGRNFCVTDSLAQLTVVGRTDLDLGCVGVSGTLRVQDSATLDLYRATAGRFELRNSAAMTSYDVTGTVTELRNTSRLTVRGLRGTTGTLLDTAVVTGWGATLSRWFPLTLTYDTLSLSSGARVDVDAQGLLGSLRDGNGMQGRTVGNVAGTASPLSGGSHGGYGGIQAGAPQQPFGDIYQPVTPGGGATSNNTTSVDYAGGNGGGALRVIVSGVLTLDGRFTANGGRGPNYDAGGAGGSIWVTAGTLSRTATGLAVQASGSYGYYSGGGGGRIALHYGALGGTWTVDAASVQAYGGPGGIYGVGGSGTVLYHRTSEANGRLLLSAPPGMVSAYARTRIGAFGTVGSVSGNVLNTTAPLQAGALVGRQLRPDMQQAAVFTIASNTASSITVVESGLAAATAAGRTFAVTDYHTDFDEVIVENGVTVDLGRLAVSGGITVRNTALLDFSELASATLDVRDSTRLYGRRLTIGALTQRNTSRITVRDVQVDSLAMTESALLTGWSPTATTIYPVTITAGTMSVGPSAVIHTDGLGYLGSLASGGLTARTNGNVFSAASPLSGGSHGGHGGIQAGAAAPSYGDLLRPAVAGGGGTSNNTTNTDYTGGNGGGVIRVSVSGNLALDGRISAGGGRGPNYDAGGAGGSVWIDAGTISRATASGFAVEANGSYGYYSGGGGGRIALYYGALSGWAVSASTVRALGGAAGIYGVGGSGTVVYHPASQARPNLLLTAASGTNSAYARTRLGAFGTVSSVSGAVINTSTVLEPGTLVGRTVVSNAENEGQTFTVISNTASSITVDAPVTNTPAGSVWYARDHHSQFANVLVQGDVEVVSGYLDVDGTAVLEGTADLAVTNADLADFTLRGTATRLDARRVSGTTLRFGGASTTTLRTIAGTTVVVDGTAVVTGLPASLTAVWPMAISATDLTIGSTARVVADALGYLGSLQRGNGLQGRTNGNVASTASPLSGGSHGGRGGLQAGSAAAVYGSSTQPVTPGGGGTSNNTTNGDYAGGNGGGVLRIQVSNRFTHDGVVSANGGRGPNYDTGGAGGSIWVSTGVLASGGAGRFEAQGSYGYYSGGGGGRIAIESGSTSGWTGNASTLRVGGGAAGIYGVGAAGTAVTSGL